MTPSDYKLATSYRYHRLQVGYRLQVPQATGCLQVTSTTGYRLYTGYLQVPQATGCIQVTYRYHRLQVVYRLLTGTTCYRLATGYRYHKLQVTGTTGYRFSYNWPSDNTISWNHDL
ncbi:hypothetical protein CDAR_453081 [Caerostris darwini]|uniref:Uncharacterized protein n=1 Tax=Caerostris darwini TaxID=1538125 RepID=A0AAV4T7X4_9ARAC|nr:hypothetical protein CDAR_453081 [Caerostris darwini]